MATWGGDQEGGNGFKGWRQGGVNGGRSEAGKGRGPALESRPARTSSVSGDIVGEIRKSGFRGLVKIL